MKSFEFDFLQMTLVEGLNFLVSHLLNEQVAKYARAIFVK
jgi:hypothetical protein